MRILPYCNEFESVERLGPIFRFSLRTILTLNTFGERCQVGYQ